MSNREALLEGFLNIVNEIKKTGFTPEAVDMEAFIGGELGVDSVEMLEAWYELEKQYHIKVPDGDKRNIYTIGDLMAVLEHHMHDEAAKS